MTSLKKTLLTLSKSDIFKSANVKTLEEHTKVRFSKLFDENNIPNPLNGFAFAICESIGKAKTSGFSPLRDYDCLFNSLALKMEDHSKAVLNMSYFKLDKTKNSDDYAVKGNTKICVDSASALFAFTQAYPEKINQLVLRFPNEPLHSEPMDLFSKSLTEFAKNLQANQMTRFELKFARVQKISDTAVSALASAAKHTSIHLDNVLLTKENLNEFKKQGVTLRVHDAPDDAELDDEQENETVQFIVKNVIFVKKNCLPADMVYKKAV